MKVSESYKIGMSSGQNGLRVMHNQHICCMLVCETTRFGLFKQNIIFHGVFSKDEKATNQKHTLISSLPHSRFQSVLKQVDAVSAEQEALRSLRTENVFGSIRS